MLNKKDKLILQAYLLKNDVRKAFQTLWVIANLLAYFLKQIPEAEQTALDQELIITQEKIADISANEAVLLNQLLQLCRQQTQPNVQDLVIQAFASTLQIMNIDSIEQLDIELSDNRVRSLINHLCGYFNQRFNNILAYWAATTLNKSFQALSKEDYQRMIEPYRLLYKAISLHARQVQVVSLLVLSKKPRDNIFLCAKGEEQRELQQGMLVIYPEQHSWTSCLITHRDPNSDHNPRYNTTPKAIELIKKHGSGLIPSLDTPHKIKLSSFFENVKKKILSAESESIDKAKYNAELLKIYPNLDVALDMAEKIYTEDHVLHHTHQTSSSSTLS